MNPEAKAKGHAKIYNKNRVIGSMLNAWRDADSMAESIKKKNPYSTRMFRVVAGL